MQGWHYGKGLIYYRPIFRPTKLVFLRANGNPTERISEFVRYQSLLVTILIPWYSSYLPTLKTRPIFSAYLMKSTSSPPMVYLLPQCQPFFSFVLFYTLSDVCQQHLLTSQRFGKRNQLVIFTRCVNLCIQTVFSHSTYRASLKLCISLTE